MCFTEHLTGASGPQSERGAVTLLTVAPESPSSLTPFQREHGTADLHWWGLPGLFGQSLILRPAQNGSIWYNNPHIQI